MWLAALCLTFQLASQVKSQINLMNITNVYNETFSSKISDAGRNTTLYFGANAVIHPINKLLSSKIEGNSNLSDGDTSFAIEINPHTGELELVITEKSLLPMDNNNTISQSQPEGLQHSQKALEIIKMLNASSDQAVVDIIDPISGKMLGKISQNNMDRNSKQNSRFFSSKGTSDSIDNIVDLRSFVIGDGTTRSTELLRNNDNNNDQSDISSLQITSIAGREDNRAEVNGNRLSDQSQFKRNIQHTLSLNTPGMLNDYKKLSNGLSTNKLNFAPVLPGYMFNQHASNLNEKIHRSIGETRISKAIISPFVPRQKDFVLNKNERNPEITKAIAANTLSYNEQRRNKVTSAIVFMYIPKHLHKPIDALRWIQYNAPKHETLLKVLGDHSNPNSDRNKEKNIRKVHRINNTNFIMEPSAEVSLTSKPSLDSLRSTISNLLSGKTSTSMSIHPSMKSLNKPSVTKIENSFGSNRGKQVRMPNRHKLARKGGYK